MTKITFRFIWNFSETFYLPLGRFAPFAFEKMIGFKGVKLDKEDSFRSRDIFD